MGRYDDERDDYSVVPPLPMDNERAKREAYRDDQVARVNRIIDSAPPIPELPVPPKASQPEPPPPIKAVEEAPKPEPAWKDGIQRLKEVFGSPKKTEPGETPIWKRRRDEKKSK